jgi:hypothetical protein
VGSGLAGEAGGCSDGLEQHGVDAGLLVGAVPGLVFGDGAAVLGLAGELTDAGGNGRVNAGQAALVAASRMPGANPRVR